MRSLHGFFFRSVGSNADGASTVSMAVPTRNNENFAKGISVAVCAYYANAIGHRVNQDAVCEREQRILQEVSQ
jgi:hypothetical protein